jgi:tripeptidyl-peptidase-1
MPHAFAVGGTTGGKDAFRAERAAAVESGSKITTGGGFSNIFPMPEWQKPAVARYLKQYAYDLPPSSFFNASNRAYPDIALAAEDVALIFSAFADSKETAATTGAGASSEVSPRARVSSEGSSSELGRLGRNLDARGALDTDLRRRATHFLTESSGTSYGASLFAGMVSLINDERLRMNKTTVGFVAPALYAAHRTDGQAVFRDIKEGSSKCPNTEMTGAMVGCCKHGFRAGKGWDPLTGLGSVDFQKLREEFSRLP